MNDSNELFKVISDDTYVFSFLMYFYVSGRCTRSMCMNSPEVGQAVVDMKATAEKHPSTSKFILSLRALIGSDTVVAPNGIGKRTGIKGTKDYQSRESHFCR